MHDEAASAKSPRLLSLDVFRGATIAAMLLVNNPGSWKAVYPPLEHAEWNGCTPTDLIFPFFLFIVGVSISFSLASRLGCGRPGPRLYGQILRRAALLFLLGLFLHAFSLGLKKMTLAPAVLLPDLRIPGVLQRIALCYLFASLMALRLSTRALLPAALILVFGYGLLMIACPVPVEVNGAVAWRTGPLEKEANLAAVIDAALLKGHLWKDTWDPEGLLSTLPAIATTLFGVWTGALLRRDIAAGEKIRTMLLAGTAGLAGGLLLHLRIPVNKSLWSSSYTLLTAGLAMYCLAACYWHVDVRGRRGGLHPFLVFGTNAITVYVLSGIFARLLDAVKLPQAAGAPASLKALIYQGIASGSLPAEASSLAYALGFVLFWYGVMSIFHHRKIFIRI